MDGIRTTELHPDGECKHRLPHEEKTGEGTRASDKDPPPHTTAGKARARHRPKRHGKETEGGGHTQRGQQGDAPPTDPSQGGRGTTQPRQGGGARHTAPTPNRAAKPRPQRRGQAPQRTTNTPHTRPSVHTTHTPTTATDTSPTSAHHTPKHRRRPHHTRNTHKPKQQEPSNPPGGLQGRQKPLGRKGGPTKPAARSGERPHPVTPERPRPTPGPGTTTPTPAPPPTPKRTPRHPHQRTHPKPAEAPSATPATPAPTNNKPTQKATQHCPTTAPNRSGPPPARTQNHRHRHPRHRKHQHRQKSSQHNTLTNTVTTGTNAYDTYACHRRFQHLHHPSQRHQAHHRRQHPTISVATSNLCHRRTPKPPQPVSQQTTKPRPGEARARARNHHAIPGDTHTTGVANTTLTHDTTRSNTYATYTNSSTSRPHHLLHTPPDRATETDHRPERKPRTTHTQTHANHHQHRQRLRRREP